MSTDTLREGSEAFGTLAMARGLGAGLLVLLREPLAGVEERGAPLLLSGRGVLPLPRDSFDPGRFGGIGVDDGVVGRSTSILSTRREPSAVVTDSMVSGSGSGTSPLGIAPRSCWSDMISSRDCSTRSGIPEVSLVSTASAPCEMAAK